MDRLFALNAKRAEEERIAGLGTAGKKGGKAANVSTKTGKTRAKSADGGAKRQPVRKRGVNDDQMALGREGNDE